MVTSIGLHTLPKLSGTPEDKSFSVPLSTADHLFYHATAVTLIHLRDVLLAMFARTLCLACLAASAAAAAAAASSSSWLLVFVAFC